MNPNNSNSVSVNSDSIFHEEPGFEKAKTLSKILLISRGDYRLFSYLGQQWYDPKETNEFLRHLKPYSGQKPTLDRWQTYIAQQKKEGYDSFEYTADKTVWVFLVNAKKGHVRYVMWLEYSD